MGAWLGGAGQWVGLEHWERRCLVGGWVELDSGWEWSTGSVGGIGGWVGELDSGWECSTRSVGGWVGGWVELDSGWEWGTGSVGDIGGWLGGWVELDSGWEWGTGSVGGIGDWMGGRRVHVGISKVFTYNLLHSLQPCHFEDLGCTILLSNHIFTSLS